MMISVYCDWYLSKRFPVNNQIPKLNLGYKLAKFAKISSREICKTHPFAKINSLEIHFDSSSSSFLYEFVRFTMIFNRIAKTVNLVNSRKFILAKMSSHKVFRLNCRVNEIRHYLYEIT